MEPIQPTSDSSAGAVTSHKAIEARGIQGAILRVLRECFTTSRGWWVICIGFAAVLTWGDRNLIYPDGLSYLDIGSEVSSGHLNALGNSYWSPAYPALIGVADFVLRPSPAYEVPVLQLVNFAIFLLTLFGFSLFYSAWSKTIPEYVQAGSTAKGLFTLFAFATFLRFTSLSVGITASNPDMLVGAMVFLVAALGIRVARPGTGWKQFALLGVVLGTGIYVKAALFPLAFAFIALLFVSLAWRSVVPVVPWRRQFANLVVTTATCVLVATPLIACLSLQAGKLTMGSVGKLNYMWGVDNFVPNHVGWAGGTAPEYGIPTHPPRKLMENPTVLEFATPVPGTYPLWHSPGYWYAGAKTVFNLRKQVAATLNCLRLYAKIVKHSFVFAAGVIVLLLFSMSKSAKEIRWRFSFWLVTWPLAACAMYALVRLHERYVAPFLLLLCLEIYRALAFRVGKRVAVTVCALVLLVALAPVALVGARSLETSVRQFRHPVDADYVAVAHNLQNLGLQPGDELAVFGDAYRSYYARYDRMRVVSQILTPDDFWRLNPADAKRVEDRIASIGVKAIIAVNRPPSNQEAGWIEVGTVADAGSISVLVLRPAKGASQ
jgi:hypothetical protein